MHLLIVSCKENANLPRPDLHLHQDWRVSKLDCFADLEAQVKLSSPPSDLILAYQDRPKQLSQATVLRLLSARPLLRIIQVLGPWCDGDLRTPGCLSGVLTINFRDADRRLPALLEEFRQGKGPLVRPLTSLESLHQKPRQPSPPMRVGIQLPRQLALGLSASLTALGHQPIHLSDATTTNALDAIIIDGDSNDDSALLQQHTPALRLHGFSRLEDDHSLAKLCSLADLDAGLRGLVQRP
jgi:hypothetical protein